MPATPSEAALSLSALVVQPAAHSPLSAAQRRFNDLLARIEELTAHMQALSAWSDRHRYAHIQNLRASQQRIQQHRKSLLFCLHDKYQTADLSAQQQRMAQRKLRSLLAQLANTADSADPQVRALADLYVSEEETQEEAQALAEAAQRMRERMEQALGQPIEKPSQYQTPDEMLAAGMRQWQRQQQADDERKAAKRAARKAHKKVWRQKMAKCVRAGTKGRDFVFHLGALIAIPYSYQAPRSYVRANIEGTLNVLQSAMDEGVQRVLHTSTSEVYGTALFVPITEEHPLQGQSPYSASKIGADKMAEAFAASFELEVVTVRPFNTFGPRQSMRAVIPTIISQCLRGHDVKLGAVSPTRDLNYVQNTVEGFCAAALSPKASGETINFGSGREISVGDLAVAIGKIFGKDVNIICEQERLRPVKSEVERLLACNKKAKALTGWEPRVSLEEGLEQTVAWIQKNAEHYKAQGYVV